MSTMARAGFVNTQRTYQTGGSYSPPYQVPLSGQAVLIGTNYANDVKPSSHSTAQWSSSLMGTYGGGCYVADYSAGGAYVLAGSGGHSHEPNFGGCLFDFADGTWKRVDNSNGMAWRANDLTLAEVNASGEISIGGVTANTMPAPFHPYMHVVPVPTSLGGGSQGSVLALAQIAQTVNADSASYYSHRFDLASGAWSRLSTNQLSGVDPTESPGLYDSVGGLYWQIDKRLDSVGPRYLDPADWTWRTASGWGGASFIGETSAGTLDPQRRLLVGQTTGVTNSLRLINLANLGAGALDVSVTGTALPEEAGRPNRWAYDPNGDCFYTYPGSGTTLYRIRPPATNPTVNAWTCSTVTPGGSAPPANPYNSIGGGNDKRHYSRFFHVPAIACFAWIADTDKQVWLFRP